MKRISFVVLSLCFMLVGRAQEKTTLDLSGNSCCRFQVTYNDVKTICMEARSINQLHDLYNMDVCSYYNLTQYDTELKRKAFANSEDGKAVVGNFAVSKNGKVN